MKKSIVTFIAIASMAVFSANATISTAEVEAAQKAWGEALLKSVKPKNQEKQQSHISTNSMLLAKAKCCSSLL